MANLQERKDMNPDYQWDLTTLFPDDTAWEKALEELNPEVEKLAAFQGKLRNAEQIRKFFNLSTAVERKLSDLFCYASMRKSEDTRADAAQQMYQKVYGLYVRYATATAFADPEILSLPEETLTAVKNDPLLDEYGRIMEKLVREKPHMLSAEGEKLLAGFSEVFANPGETAGALQDADLVFDPAEDRDGKKHEVTESGYIALESSSDRVLRENAFHSFYKTYRQHIHTFASTYGGEIKASVAVTSARKYGSSREMYMASENIPPEVYDNLVTTVRKYMPEMYRYVRLRKKLLGVDELHYYDLYAPLAGKVQKSYTYQQAQQMVKDAVRPLGDRYGRIVAEAFRSRWIDVYPNLGKQSGAYSTGTYDSNPFIMTNFTGTLDSVSTIAHEMGHSMHTWFSNHGQPPQDAEYTIFVAEVASTVNENLLIEMLLRENENTLDKAERLSLLNQYLEGFKGTVYRQTMFAEFEREAHAMAERGEAVSAASLNSLYRKLVTDYFGPDLVMDDEVELEWARIPHFYSPFYVYKYATSYSAAVAISEAILQDQEKLGEDHPEFHPAVKRYLEFLSMGDSQDPIPELRHAGVDLSKPEPIAAALEKFGRVLDEAEGLADEI